MQNSRTPKDKCQSVFGPVGMTLAAENLLYEVNHPEASTTGPINVFEEVNF